MNFSGCVGRVIILSRILTIACCLVVRLGFGLDLVSGCQLIGCAHVFVLLSVVIISLKCPTSARPTEKIFIK